MFGGRHNVDWIHQEVQTTLVREEDGKIWVAESEVG